MVSSAAVILQRVGANFLCVFIPRVPTDNSFWTTCSSKPFSYRFMAADSAFRA